MLFTLACALLAPALAVCLYYLVLAMAAHWPRQRSVRSRGSARTRFAILMPAHNEEAQLAETLTACRALDYPPDQFQVIVIADNCTDRTAALARANGVRCLERHDTTRRGKGQALAWALDRILPERPDAVLILDADCRLDAHALRTFDAQLQAGHAVLQASYVAANPDQSIVSYVSAVANAIENDLFYAPKSTLGLAVLLRGTGMVFRRDVFERCPWHAESIVEDVEYTIRLAEEGLAVRFVPDVRVWSAFPTQADQMRVQRTRWIGGNVRLALRQSLPLLVRGVLSGRPALCDLGWTLLVSVRSLIVLYGLLAVLAALGISAFVPGAQAVWLRGVSLGLLLAAGVYFGLGVARLGLSWHRWLLLVQTPLTVVRLLGVASASLLPGGNRAWERTPR